MPAPRVLGEVDLFSAQVLVHERAIYMHESVQYYVDRLEWGERKAYVHKIDADHYTYANRAVTLKPLDIFGQASTQGGRRIHGEVMVASLVTLFKKLKFVTDENVARAVAFAGDERIVVPAGERHKTLAGAEEVLRALARALNVTAADLAPPAHGTSH